MPLVRVLAVARRERGAPGSPRRIGSRACPRRRLAAPAARRVAPDQGDAPPLVPDRRQGAHGAHPAAQPLVARDPARQRAGVTTGPMPCEAGLAEIELDLVAHRAVVRTSEGATRDFALHDGLAVAAFYERLFAALDDLGVSCVIRPTPFDLADATAFLEDRSTAVRRRRGRALRAVLRSAADAFGEFSGRFSGKTSPVQLFWHSFDLAVTRFGRRAPASEGADPVTAEAYSHEVVSFGFWAGDDRIPMPAFYSYTAPEPPGLVEQPSPRRRPRGRRGRPARWPCCRTRTSARSRTCARR